MEDFLEILFTTILEIVFDGAIETTVKKKVPLPVRILLIIVLFAVYGGLVGIFVFVVIHERKLEMLLLGLLILFLVIFGLYKANKRRHKPK